jgi:hypothetical protein
LVVNKREAKYGGYGNEDDKNNLALFLGDFGDGDFVFADYDIRIAEQNREHGF